MRFWALGVSRIFQVSFYEHFSAIQGVSEGFKDLQEVLECVRRFLVTGRFRLV